MGPDRSSISLMDEEKRARVMLLDLVPASGVGIRWDAVWPVVLSRCVIRLTDLKRIANEYRKSGALEFPDWPRPANRTPKNDYLVRRGGEALVQRRLF
jgi:hypothetical protein